MEQAPGEELMPFRERLIKRRRGHRIFQTTSSLKGKKIIRRSEITAGNAEEEHKKHKYRDFVIGRKEFERLSDQYKIAVPKFLMVRQTVMRGKKEKVGDSMFTIVDEIRGKDLREVDSIPPEAASKFNRFFEALVQYFVDAYNEKRPYLDDIFSPRQYKYGRKPGDSEDQIYLVDLEPYLAKTGLAEGRLLITSLEEITIPWIIDFKKRFFNEGDFGSAIKKARGAIEYLNMEQERQLKSVGSQTLSR